MGATLNLIEIWIKLLEKNYDAKRVSYITAMKEIPQKIPTTTTKPISPRKKVQKLMTEIGGGWYTEKITKGLTLLRIPKLSKKAQEKEEENKKHMKLIGIVMIVNSNYIGTSLNGLIQEVKSKENTLLSFFNFFT